jgi:hypothetical protein
VIRNLRTTIDLSRLEINGFLEGILTATLHPFSPRPHAIGHHLSLPLSLLHRDRSPLPPTALSEFPRQFKDVITPREMSDPSTINANLLNWCRREQAALRQQIDLLSSGKMKTQYKEGNGPWVDTTAEQLEHFQSNLAELDEFITQLEGESDL